MEITGKIIKVTEFTKYPKLFGKLRLPDNNWSPEIEFIVDTGFTGDILLNTNLFSIWSSKMQRMPEDAEIAESISGELLELESVDSHLNFDDKAIIPIIISSHSTIMHNLVGWNILRKFISILESDKFTIID